jgi:hypothetical protein
MSSHIIAFNSLVPKVYGQLPLPMEDLDEVLSILFTGPCKPTEKEFQCTLLLVRRKQVAHVLEWLKLNHSDYADMEIAYDELDRYLEQSPPVSIKYQHSLSNKVEERTSIFDNAFDDGVEEGDCPFVVHGLMGEQYDMKSLNALKGTVLRHWNNRGGALAMSHVHIQQSQSVPTDIPLAISVWLGRYRSDFSFRPGSQMSLANVPQ